MRGIVALSCLLVWAGSAAGQDEDGAWPEPSHERSTCQQPKQCKAACNDGAGNAAACRRLAYHYNDGIGVEPSHANAAKLWKQACDKGDGLACIEYAFLVRDGYMYEVPRDKAAYDEYIARAQNLTEYACNGYGDGSAESCYAKTMFLWRTKRGEIDDIGEIIDPAFRACEQGAGEACVWLEENLRSLAREAVAKQMSEQRETDGMTKDQIAEFETQIETEFEQVMTETLDTLKAQYRTSCETTKDPTTCMRAGQLYLDDAENVDWGKERAKKRLLAKSAFAIACAADNREACFQSLIIEMEELESKDDVADSVGKDMMTKAIATCQGLGHAACFELVDAYFTGSDDIPKDDDKAFALLDSLCLAGHREVCERSAREYIDDKKHRAVAITAMRRMCLRGDPTSACELCSAEPNDQVCTARTAWALQTACMDGESERCEDLGRVYTTGIPGLDADLDKAAQFHRRACAGNVKTACVALDDLCSPKNGATKLTDDAMCQQSLIQSDLFYEAEWQFRTTGSAKVLGDKKAGDDKDVVGQAKVTGSNGGSGGAGVSLQRGSLDASLVMSIVLDRARQAAIRLVVDELMSASRGRTVPGYLIDLLTQAATLLGDQNTLRQEKFADLGMTVVRAFVASNLVSAVFGDAERLVKHELWTELAAETSTTWDPSKLKDKDRAAIHAYIVDWAYFLLGEIKLFGKAVGEAVNEPTCRFDNGAGKQICDWIEGGRGKLKGALRVDLMVTGLGLVKALREEGSIDMRRFIEAASRAKVIANLHTTPGLSLDEWRNDIARRFRGDIKDIGEKAGEMLWLIDPAVWKGSIDWDKSVAAATHIKALLADNRNALARFGPDDIRVVLAIADTVMTASTTYRAAGFQISERTRVEEKLKKDVAAMLTAWKTRAGFVTQVKDFTVLVQSKMLPAIRGVENTAMELEAFMDRFHPRVDDVITSMSVKASFSISDVPLSDLPELREHFQAAAKRLQALDDVLGAVLPGVRRSVLRAAIGSVVRLLGFFDLMERVARTAQLDARCGDIIDAIKTLGAIRDDTKEFVAPVFDVMAPVLAAIQTHEPMSADLLFAIIEKVRLDSLITSLAAKVGGKKPCERDDGGYECWTVKIVHALQEAVQRDGDNVIIDGGAFAQRLASHGDDFRRKHKWRSYFHLTVGFGGMFSLAPPASDGTGDGADRFVPLVSEQIGFGWASPSFWSDRLTFKVGLAASGLLYRAVIDSAESDAIMFSPFIAFDVYDLVELYAAPTLLVYPPIGDTDAGVRFGASFGLTVPLDAYLQKL